MIPRDRLDHLLRSMFDGCDLIDFKDAIRTDGDPGINPAGLFHGDDLDTEDAATVLRIISGEDFEGRPPAPQPFIAGHRPDISGPYIISDIPPDQVLLPASNPRPRWGNQTSHVENRVDL